MLTVDVKNKRVLMVGAGKTGIAVAGFLNRQGARVTVTDGKGREDFKESLDFMENSGVTLALGDYPAVAKDTFDLLVVSPGVPPSVAPIASALEQGIPVLGELELAYAYACTPIVAITGTNGKTTTTTLIGEIFKNAGYNTLVAGNIGLPLVDQVEKFTPEDIIVAEVSSFQLETVRHFRPRVAAVLNVTPDHLDRHGDMEGYLRAKAMIFTNQGSEDFTVLNFDDPLTRKMRDITKGKVIFFSRRHILEEGVFVRDGQIVITLAQGDDTVVLPADKLQIPGGHNLENALAATACAAVMGVPTASVARTLANFKGVAHRLEFVAEINGVKYVNDSKGTNPDASVKAVEAYEQPLVLIAGGKNKGNDFAEFTSKAFSKARVMVVLGQCAEEMAAAARNAGIKNILQAGDFREAVLLAHRAARPGDVVLLSPACASWDMFNNYEERGDYFKQIVKSLEIEV
jgi:UDP-N-acetylmuramoylalanine--D-glutamate ligase